MKFSQIAIMLVAMVSASSGVFGQAELKTVPSVDLERYSGKWYEIARYPNRFQKQCAANVTATYRQKSNGRIEVVNECLKTDGKSERAKGDAKIVENSGNSKLKVRFAPAFLSFIRAVWGDYWIIELDPEYKYVVIGEPKRDYFWILSRESTMDDTTYQGILNRAEAMGFEPGKVVKTQQK